MASPANAAAAAASSSLPLAPPSLRRAPTLRGMHPTHLSSILAYLDTADFARALTLSRAFYAAAQLPSAWGASDALEQSDTWHSGTSSAHQPECRLVRLHTARPEHMHLLQRLGSLPVWRHATALEVTIPEGDSAAEQTVAHVLGAPLEAQPAEDGEQQADDEPVQAVTPSLYPALAHLRWLSLRGVAFTVPLAHAVCVLSGQHRLRHLRVCVSEFMLNSGFRCLTQPQLPITPARLTSLHVSAGDPLRNPCDDTLLLSALAHTSLQQLSLHFSKHVTLHPLRLQSGRKLLPPELSSLALHFRHTSIHATNGSDLQLRNLALLPSLTDLSISVSHDGGDPRRTSSRYGHVAPASLMSSVPVLSAPAWTELCVSRGPKLRSLSLSQYALDASCLDESLMHLFALTALHLHGLPSMDVAAFGVLVRRLPTLQVLRVEECRQLPLSSGAIRQQIMQWPALRRVEWRGWLLNDGVAEVRSAIESLAAAQGANAEIDDDIYVQASLEEYESMIVAAVADMHERRAVEEAATRTVLRQLRTQWNEARARAGHSSSVFARTLETRQYATQLAAWIEVR